MKEMSVIGQKHLCVCLHSS